MRKTRSTSALGCPCGRPNSYEQCCGRYHAGPLALQAADPESLMRSRYSAFVRDLRPYLLDTWHASERPEAIEAPEPGLKWLGLSVREARLTGDAEGRVSFVARFKIGGRAHRLEEVSRFVFEQGRWWYVKAVPTEPA
jgi:SEC-C motif-containing protein